MSRVRFAHTADWQIGMKAVHVGAVGQRVREERLRAAARVVREAKDRGADFLLVAGDTFEDNRIEGVAIQQTVDILRGFGGPVLIIPGNHDPLVPGSVWEHGAWGQAANVRVLRQPVPVRVADATVFPCPIVDPGASEDPTTWMRSLDAPGIRIGLAHGTVEGARVDEPFCPIGRNAAELARLDYLALGHWHSRAQYSNGRMAYSGTPEPTKFGERDSGSMLMVEVDGALAAPVLTPVATAGLTWRSEDLEVHGTEDITVLAKDLAALDPVACQSTLLSVRLSGGVDDAAIPALDALRDLVAARFLYQRIDCGSLAIVPRSDGWITSIQSPLLKEVAVRLARASTAASDPASAGNARVAARALRELYLFLKASGA
jgi:hypothetical protein